ncbi:hypothetical protein GCM10010176_023940 [Nonomuraea spiralis]|nr:hypothetical protein GCM10010176_023940 [Nonomuraea spiralis]
MRSWDFAAATFLSIRDIRLGGNEHLAGNHDEAFVTGNTNSRRQTATVTLRKVASDYRDIAVR